MCIIYKQNKETARAKALQYDKKGRMTPADYCSLTKTAAIPIPDPIHMLVTKTLPPVCLAMDMAVAI